MDKLISMIDFVLEQFTLLKQWKISEQIFILRISQYAKLLKQPLTLGMFVACDLENYPLLPPGSAPIYTHSNKYMIEYQEAKERVLFEGGLVESNPDYPNFIPLKLNGAYFKSWDIKNNEFHDSEKWSVETLIFLNLKLTQTAQKQIG